MTTSAQHLPQLAAVAFRGGEAAQFLNGQLTINTETLAAGRWQRATYCSRQGRMIANGMLAHLPAAGEPHFMFLMSADIAEAVATMLKRFVLRAKVSIEVPPVHVFASDAAATPPALAGGDMRVDEDGVAELDEGGGRRLLFNTAERALADMQSRWEGEGSGWQQAEIERGVPWISAATQDALIPQFVNFELLGGVDFEKGCFVGQEVIARLHHLGAVKRRGMIIRGKAAAAAGDELKTVAGKPAGEVVNSVVTGDGFIAFAAVVKAAMAEALLVNGGAVAVQAPPYPIVEQEKFKRQSP